MCITQHPNCMHHIADCIVIVKSRTDSTEQRKRKNASVAPASEQAPFISEMVGSILATENVKRVCQHSTESRGFSPGAPVPPTGKVGRVG